jgi:uncharacterized low-complexity protein
MSKKHVIKPVSLAVGAAFVAGMASAPAVQADVNPFAVTALSSGYMVADKGTEGNCGAKKPVTEAECGANKAKQVKEAECGANKKAEEAKCGANKAKPKPIKEAKCGEAKCGENKK